MVECRRLQLVCSGELMIIGRGRGQGARRVVGMPLGGSKGRWVIDVLMVEWLSSQVEVMCIASCCWVTVERESHQAA